MKINIPDTKVYKVFIKDLWNEKTIYATKDDIVHRLFWCKGNSVTLIDDQIRSDFKGVTIEEVGSGSGRCYLAKTYKLESDRELFDHEFEILRALGVFLEGQVTGKVYNHQVVDGKHIYMLSSERDSSD